MKNRLKSIDQQYICSLVCFIRKKQKKIFCGKSYFFTQNWFLAKDIPCAQSKILFFGIFLTRGLKKKALKNVLNKIEQRKFEVAWTLCKKLKKLRSEHVVIGAWSCWKDLKVRFKLFRRVFPYMYRKLLPIRPGS